MLKSTRLPLLFATTLLVAACDGGGGDGDGDAQGIASLGASFVNAFNLSRTDAPVDAQDVTLVLTPGATPFNP